MKCSAGDALQRAVALTTGFAAPSRGDDAAQGSWWRELDATLALHAKTFACSRLASLRVLVLLTCNCVHVQLPEVCDAD